MTATRTPGRASRAAPTSTVLHDALGPRGRRRVTYATILSGLAIGAFVVYFAIRLSESGQLEAARWSYVTDPDILRFLLEGLLNNLIAAGIAGALALTFGIVLALGRLSEKATVRRPTIAWIEFFRGFPALLLIIFPALLIPAYYQDIDPLWYVVIGLTLYNSAVMAEIYRAGILSVERGQSEAAASLGLTHTQAMRLVIMPQAIRRMIPLLLTQLIILFKDTTLGQIVFYEEALRRGVNLGSFQTQAVFQSILVTAVLFFMASFVLSRTVALVERRQRRREGALAVPAAVDADLQKTGPA